MCGIAGLLDLEGRLSPDLMSDSIAAMTAALSRRGPGTSRWSAPTGGWC